MSKIKKANKSEKGFQFNSIILILGALVMMILGAATTFAVTKMITPYSINNSSSAIPTAVPQPITPVTQTVSKVTTTPAIRSLALAPTTTVVSDTHIPSTENNAAEDTQPTPTTEPMMAKIINIKPQYTTQSYPYRACRWVQRPILVHEQHAIDGSGVLLGGVTGGLVGHQIGQGNGNIAATIGGTVLGALVGNQMEREINRPDVHYVPVKVCKRHYETKSILKGYNVTYSYNGKQETKFMKKKPQTDYIQLTLTPALES